jgi:hypothetical protein
LYVKKPSRRRLSITTGTRDKIYVLPPYFHLYLTIKTSLGSIKPSPVTGLAVFPYCKLSGKPLGRDHFPKILPVYTAHRLSAKIFCRKNSSFIVFERVIQLFYNCIVLYQHGQVHVNHGIIYKFTKTYAGFYMLFALIILL